MRGLYNRSSISTVMRRESLDFLRRWRDLSTCRIAVVVVGWFPLSLFSLLLFFFKGLLLDDIMLNCYTDDGVRAKKEKGRRIWAVSVSMGVVCMFRCILTRRTNKCFWRFTFYDIFLSFFFVLFSIFFFPSATVSLAVLPFVLFHFPTSFFFTQEKEKKKRVTEDKAVNYKKRIAPGVAPNTQSQCHILHTPKELSLYILFNAHGFSLFCFVFTWWPALSRFWTTHHRPHPVLRGWSRKCIIKSLEFFSFLFL